MVTVGAVKFPSVVTAAEPERYRCTSVPQANPSAEVVQPGRFTAAPVPVELQLLSTSTCPVVVPGVPNVDAPVNVGVATVGLVAATGEPVPVVAVNDGAALPPVKFPKAVFAAALLRLNESAGVVVAVATDVVNSGESVPALKLVTVPLLPEQAAQDSGPVVPADCRHPAARAGMV